MRDGLHLVIAHETDPSAPLRVEVFGKLYSLTGDSVADVAVAGGQPLGHTCFLTQTRRRLRHAIHSGFTERYD